MTNALGQIPLTKNEILSQENSNLKISEILAQVLFYLY